MAGVNARKQGTNVWEKATGIIDNSFAENLKHSVFSSENMRRPKRDEVRQSRCDG